MKRKKKRSDDFDLLMDEIYEFTDRIVGTLNRIYIANFNKLKSISYQELNMMESAKVVYAEVEKVYTEIDQKTRAYLLMLAKKVYKTITEYYDFELVMDYLTMDWIIRELESFDPVTKYVYVHEVDRKSARLAEAIIASDTVAKEVETGLRLWARQANQYADIIVEKAVEQVYEDNGVKYVRWKTEDDIRVCADCDGLDDMVIPLGSISVPLHPRCRCYTEKATEAEWQEQQESLKKKPNEILSKYLKPGTM